MLSGGAILLSGFALFAIVPMRMLNFSLPQMFTHFIAGLAVLAMVCLIAICLLCAAAVVELCDRAPCVAAGFILACIGISLSILTCGSTGKDLIKAGTELVMSRVSKTSCGYEESPGFFLMNLVNRLCDLGPHIALFDHCGKHGVAWCLKLNAFADNAMLTEFFASDEKPWLCEEHWPTGVCAHFCYITVVNAGLTICRGAKDGFVTGFKRLRNLFWTGFLDWPHMLSERGRAFSLGILRTFGYKELEFWRRANTSDLTLSHERGSTPVLYQGSRTEVVSYGDQVKLADGRCAGASELFIRAGMADPDGPLGMYRFLHPLLSKALGLFAAFACIPILAFDSAVGSVYAAGCDRWMLASISRLLNSVALFLFMFVIPAAAFFLCVEFGARVLGVVSSCILQLAIAAGVFVGKPFLCLCSAAGQFALGCFWAPATVLLCLSVFCALWALAGVVLATGFCIALSAGVAGIIYGSPFIGTLMKSILACVSCGLCGGNLEKFGCNAMSEYSRKAFTCVWDQANSCAVYCRGMAMSTKDTLKSGLSCARWLVTHFSFWWEVGTDFSLARSQLEGAAGGEASCWRSLWALGSCCAWVLLSFLMGFALGCCYRLRDTSWVATDSSNSQCLGVRPRGGVLRVVHRFASYSRRVQVIRTDGQRYFILKDVPADLGVLHVVGRPVGNPSAVLTAVVGTPLPISQQGGMPAVTGAGNVIGNQSEPLERE